MGLGIIPAPILLQELAGAVGASKDLDVELGFSLAELPGSRALDVGMFGVGLKFQVLRGQNARLAIAGGAAAGCGGRLTGLFPGNPPGCFNRPSLAGYAGADLGWRFAPWLGLYLGNRLNLGWTDQVPLTHVGQHVAGVQLQGERFFATFETGVGYLGRGADPWFANPSSVSFLSAGYAWGDPE
ncbi:MAG: hypothetical protein ACYC8T_01390 [Myxococcaceae bacterium]